MSGAPSWVAPLAALSLLIIAIGFLLLVVVLVRVAGTLSRQAEHLATDLRSLRNDLAPALVAVRDLTQDGKALTTVLRREAEALADASGHLREGVEGGALHVRRRLEELDTLYEVLYEEVEDTVLSVAASLHAVRRTTGFLGKVSRRLIRRRKVSRR